MKREVSKQVRRRARAFESVLAMLVREGLAKPDADRRQIARAARQIARDTAGLGDPLVILGQGSYKRVMHPRKKRSL